MPNLLALDRILTRRTTSETFGRYELLGRLGTGGMAEVFVARCGELPEMQSLLALKRILPHLADDDGFVALFRREALISLRLRHRAIARVFEVGRVGAAWFLTMELVPGESLAHLMRVEKERHAPVDPRLCAWVGAEIASALHHAHSLTDRGAPMPVIHRDVSPQNLLLGFDGAVRLIDFGVARCAQVSELTRTGTVRGKLAYGSPEQLHARPLDGRSDLFSLAVVLHEWLAGAPLFVRDSDAATVHAVQTSPIPPLARAPRLGAVLARALERAPERRYPNGEALADALLEAVGGRPLGAERLLATHLAALFPDRKQRWQSIIAGAGPAEVRGPNAGPDAEGRVDVASGHVRQGVGHGGTVRSTAAFPRAGSFERARLSARGRAVAAIVGAVGLVVALFAGTRTRVERAASPPPSALAKTSGVAVLPVARPADHVPPAAAPEGLAVERARVPLLAPASERLAAERSGGRRLHVTQRWIRPRARATVEGGPSTDASRAARRAVVDELEPSPYVTTK